LTRGPRWDCFFGLLPCLGQESLILVGHQLLGNVPGGLFIAGEPMTKRDMVVRITNETGLKQQDVHAVVQKTLDYISESVAQGKNVELRNFGVFEVKLRKARLGRNPRAPQVDVPIPPRAVVKFKPGKEMRETVLKLSPLETPSEQR
jgi:nucleoid DNA-binding protein